jgi:hypothetical protein
LLQHHQVFSSASLQNEKSTIEKFILLTAGVVTALAGKVVKK